MGRFLSNADMVVDIKSLIGDGLRLGDANCPISMREAKAGNWPSSFDGCCVSAPDPNDVPSCAMAIKTIGAPMPINDCYESKFQAGESSHAWEVSISPYLLPDDASYRTCVLCFQPMYNFNYICPHCHMEQDSLHVRHDMPSQSMGWTPGTGNDKLDFHKPCESKFRQAKQAHLSKDRVFTVAPTTLMIRNVPSQYTAEEIINEWPNEGDYDFLYVPYNARTQENLTYAFVNFTSHALAVEFKQQWQKKYLTLHSTKKPLNISFADVQGCYENLRQLKKKRLLHSKVKECQPLVFKDGCRISLAKALVELGTAC